MNRNLHRLHALIAVLALLTASVVTTVIVSVFSSIFRTIDVCWFTSRNANAKPTAITERLEILPTSQDYHRVGLHDALHPTDFLDALVNLRHAHAADDRDDVVFACDFVERLHVGNLAYLVGDFLRRMRRVRGEQGYGFGALGYANFDGELSYGARVGEGFDAFSDGALG